MDTNLRLVLLLVVSMSLLAPVSASSKILVIEAENFTAANNQAGNPIQAFPGSGCSGGYLLAGLDVIGEWVEYDVSVTRFGRYSLEIKCRGVFNKDYALRLVFTPTDPGDEQSVDFVFKGNGYG